MWSAISRLFSKTNSNSRNSDPVSDTKIMDRGEDRRRTTADWEPQDTYDTRQAKQRASVKWLLSKAYNNRVPDNLREPFYRDHEEQEHLKPQVVHALASAELYCLALANIYSDPNYHNLNHWGVLQALGRKGVFAAEPPDARLTETVLIQTTPLRLSAHMAVIEALMALYAKEVVTPDRVLVAVQRFGPQARGAEEALPADHEAGLLLWVNRAGQALRRRARQEIDATASSTPAAADGSKPPEITTPSTTLPELPTVREWKDLSNGVSLAALVSFYCPEELPWSHVVVGRVPTISDSMHNLMLVYNFCSRCLPSSVFHMMPEDVTYMQGSMKQNLIVFLADLFNVLEIHPVKCVRFQGTDRTLWKEVLPRNSQGVAHKRSFPQSISAIPDLRSNLAPGAQPASAAGAFTVSKSAPNIQTSMPLKKSHSLQPADVHGRSGGDSTTLQEDRRGGSGEETFVVHRGRTVPTLASVAQSTEEPLIPARLRPAKEKQNQDSKAEERGEPVAAGRPSNWEEQRRSSYAGRRSRRNSVSDDSQLTLENFGGSQENLHLLGRNPDKEPAVHVGRKSSAPESPSPATAVRSTAQDARSCGVEMLFSASGDNGYYSGEKRDEEKPTTTTAAHYAVRETAEQPAAATSFAELSRVKAEANKGITISYMQQEHEEEAPVVNNSGGTPAKSSFLNKKTNGTGGSVNGNAEKKTTTFAALPNNTTTWQQQSSNSQMMHQAESQQGSEEANGATHVMASQLHNIRMKLEEKRRRIESEKRRMEVVMSKQRQKVGKAAFLQAVTKGKGSLAKGAEPDSQSKDSSAAVEPSATRPQRPLSLQEISEDASSVEHKWLDNTLPYIEERRTPDIENMDLEQYQQSLAQMNSSLHEIQADIQRLATQQHQIQGLHSQPVPAPISFAQPSPQPPPPPQVFQPQPQPQFYLHEQQVHRRTWAQPEAPAGPFAAQDGRALWGSDRHQKPQPASYNCQSASGFMLHDPHGSPYPMGHTGNGDVRYHNGEQSHPYHHHHLHHHHPPTGMPPPLPQHHSLGVNHVAYPVTSTSPSSGGGYQSFQLHHAGEGGGSPFTGTPPSASPVHRTASVQQRISQMLGQESPEGKSEEKGRPPSGVMHAPIPTPPVDDMEPQSISFIGTPNPDEGLAQSIKGLQITSGSRTYRIPSPTRPVISRSAFHHHQQQQQQHLPDVPDGRVASPIENHQDGEGVGSTEKGFYISFDNDAQPKRPKPPLRVKRSSPKKERPMSQHENLFLSEREDTSGTEPLTVGTRQEEHCSTLEAPTPLSSAATTAVPGPSDAKAEAAASGVGIVIGTELLNPDPTVLDEMERKKERIMLLSLQRRQEQEELKARKEQEAQHRRDIQKLRQEERERKKEEERLRRAAILEQYKLKKAIEEAEREGKLLPEKSEMTPAKPVPKLRNKSSTMRPRPKTIHVDSGSVQELQEGGLSPSRSKKGSTSNLTDSVYSAPMKRDYYRGSQDSLAERLDDRRGLAASLFKDSPDDGRGASPCRSVNQLGRRGSYKTSRDTSEPRQTRGRQKYPTYQGNFRGRKSNSLMNLCGSSTDQDSMVYRYADTDSGLGRATPPRRAPSPGMSSMRHLPSPSGPGSLPPGLMTKRRMFDDGSSDISSTPSSMMEYTGPRLYKQPATKSNRGIMLNAVEYCVFPGAVNKEAKRRVLEEIGRSESKHFLILFRDAGCQFRALYAYCPEREDVAKLYGTGPKQITDRMFDKFFKYNSGGKCFSQVHTKHLTVTIDAFTIHNSLWQGKKVALPNKKDMPLVI